MAIKEILQANTADILEATELLEVLGDRTGAYVWKQLTAEGGDFVAFVTADDEGSYPNKGTQDGFYYVKFDPLTAIAENIREGVSIFDIIGTMSEGVDLSAGGITKVAIDKFTFSSDTYSSEINHSLGVVPKVAFITGGTAKGPWSYTYAIDKAVFVVANTENKGGCAVSGLNSGGACGISSYGAANINGGDYHVHSATKMQFKLQQSNGFYLAGGVEYTLITMA